MKIKRNRSFFELLLEVFGWIQIVASPLLLGIVIGLLLFLADPGGFGTVIGILVAVIGFIIGIIWATRIWKRKGTMNFMSRIMASPELDELEP
ncbi:MAG: hypothetical protein EOP48_17030 [Sphingobacteriales bacterium]|nr:MAG: hypothetical protein EOP48_17030 [Sphingobacteriales bacterium]